MQKNHDANFLLLLLNKLIREYKTLLGVSRPLYPFKIANVVSMSDVPGETCFAIQVTNKNCVLHLTAAELSSQQYPLTDFHPYHANMIRYALQGTLRRFLNQDEHIEYRIIAKRFDREQKKYLFTVTSDGHRQFVRTASELARSKEVLHQMSSEDVLDVGYTQGMESVMWSFENR